MFQQLINFAMALVCVVAIVVDGITLIGLAVAGSETKQEWFFYVIGHIGMLCAILLVMMINKGLLD